MGKISVMTIMLMLFLTTLFCGLGSAKAEVTDSGNQVFNDEGYGNSDDEYYNSTDDRTNDGESSGPQENAYAK